MKKIILLLAAISCIQTKGLGIERGNSSFAYTSSSYIAKVEKPDGSNEEICVYQKNNNDEQLVISIKEVFDKRMRHPLYVDAKIFGDELIVLLELQPPIAHFLRQRYKKVDNEWLLISENPIQAMNTFKRQRLVAGQIVSKEEVVFSFFQPVSEYKKENLKISGRSKGKPQPEDIKISYTFKDFTQEDKIAFEQKPKGLLLEVLGDQVKKDNQVYDFRKDDYSSPHAPIPGYK